jgi:hypothetical protein
MAELRVRCGTVRDGAVVRADRRDVVRIGAQAVNQQRSRVEHAVPFQHLHGRWPARLHRNAARAMIIGPLAHGVTDESGLVLALGDVNGHRE